MTPHFGMYAKDAEHRAGLMQEMRAYMDDNGPLLIERDFAPESAWGLLFRDHVKSHGNGIWSFNYLNPDFCADLLYCIANVTEYTVNEAEPVEAQIPEVVLEELMPKTFECLRGLFEGYAKDMAYLLLGLETGHCVSIQAAKYTPENTPHGCWHTDRDSEVTLVVALSDTHKGGGTEVYAGPLAPTIVVPQLPTGWAMLFPGRTNEHMGLPVTEGTRNLLVHWYKLEK